MVQALDGHSLTSCFALGFVWPSQSGWSSLFQKSPAIAGPASNQGKGLAPIEVSRQFPQALAFTAGYQGAALPTGQKWWWSRLAHVELIMVLNSWEEIILIVYQ